MSDLGHKWETQSDTFWSFSRLMRTASIGKKDVCLPAVVTAEYASGSPKIGWRTGSTCALLVGMQTGSAITGKVPQKIKNGITIWSSNSTSGHYPKEKKIKY